MAVRVGVVGARADVALMIAGVAAGCGAEVVDGAATQRSGGEGPDGRWGSVAVGEPCDLVLVDPLGNAGSAVAFRGTDDGPGGGAGGRSGVRVVLVHLPGEADAAGLWAAAWGADHVVELPAGQAWLADALIGLARPTNVLAVLGAVGGAGATTVALACAAAAAMAGQAESAAAARSACLLVDVDPWSAGLDLPLGIADGDGARWSSIPDGGGTLVADSLRASLPQVGRVVVLTGLVGDPVGPRVQAVVRAGRSDFAATVLDAGRGPAPAGLGAQDSVALVVPATLSGVVGARRMVSDLPTSRVVLAIRPTGWLPTEEVAAQVGVDCSVEIPGVRGLAEQLDCGNVLRGRCGRALRRIGHDVWGALR